MRLFIRADAGPSMGIGHVMRCLALGQAWRDAGRDVVFLTACTNPALLSRLSGEGFDVRGPEEFGNPGSRDRWLVLDGYHFDAECQLRVKRAGWRVLVVDDTAHLPHYFADAILNQNLGAESYVYSREPNAKLLLGPSYVLLRREFRRLPQGRRLVPPVARKLLVTLGGSDPQRVSPRVIEAIRSVPLPGLEAVVVVGAACEGLADLARAACAAGVRVDTNVGDMASLMAWADLAVSAAGSACWELAFSGLPAILMVVADNQRDVAAGLAERGCAINLGWHAEVSTMDIATAIRELGFDRHRRETLSNQAAVLVDGLGARRVMDVLEQ